MMASTILARAEVTYTITEVENTKAKLVVSETRTTSKEFCDVIVAIIKAKGNVALVLEEG